MLLSMSLEWKTNKHWCDFVSQVLAFACANSSRRSAAAHSFSDFVLWTGPNLPSKRAGNDRLFCWKTRPPNVLIVCSNSRRTTRNQSNVWFSADEMPSSPAEPFREEQRRHKSPFCTKAYHFERSYDMSLCASTSSAAGKHVDDTTLFVWQILILNLKLWRFCSVGHFSGLLFLSMTT